MREVKYPTRWLCGYKCNRCGEVYRQIIDLEKGREIEQIPHVCPFCKWEDCFVEWYVKEFETPYDGPYLMTDIPTRKTFFMGIPGLMPVGDKRKPHAVKRTRTLATEGGVEWGKDVDV